MRHADLEDEQRDRDREHAVAERFDSTRILVHGGQRCVFGVDFAPTRTGVEFMLRAFNTIPLALIVAACGSDSSGPAAGFECLGQALPTTAPASITASGETKYDVFPPKALSNVEIIV